MVIAGGAYLSVFQIVLFLSGLSLCRRGFPAQEAQRPVGYAGATKSLIMSKWILILGGLYSGLLLYIYVVLPALK